ncbi:HTTM domain-containing protein [Natranaeroarchaeum sulfidigenes]|uniref:HTTM domain containing membrane enzyme n=1 Tax=Natranaeroarchaeum sulfidigenes TaxID=2784880 RepID=A0A897MTR8_9EURY|nr:HTTM domain-containing protein [Natranaeroarchaeum sulfidigenes]QSG03914.1 HTTM domain containing membrane enzyme [Natranaeroarchaeum sulfidigenes]
MADLGAVRSRAARTGRVLYGGLKRRGSIDTRTLAVFRMFVAVLIVADVLSRSRNFHFYYTDDGAVTASMASDGVNVFAYTSDPTIIAALFVIHALVALQLLVGYKTRVAMIISFVFVISLDQHNPYVTSYADVLFRLLLFWALFLPLGERWSIDAVHRNREPRTSVFSLATLGALFQMIAMYVINGYHKSGEELWTGGEATPLIMGLDDTTFLLGETMRQFPELLQLGGLTWYYMLLYGWLLFFLTGRLRLVFAGMFVIAHASFAVTVRIGAFPYVAMAGLLLFAQGQFWRDLDRLARLVGLPVDRLHAAVRRLGAVARVFPRRIPTAGGELWTRRAVYTGFYGIAAFLVVALALLAVGTGAGVVPADEGPKEQVEDVAYDTMIYQPEWSIFAPVPRTTDRYHVFPAQTTSGERIDVYNDRELSFERPGKELQQQYGTYRERFYMNSVRRAGDTGPASLALAEHLCETWEGEDGEDLTHVNMYYVSENVTLETIDSPEDRDRSTHTIYRHGCGDREPTVIQDVTVG